MPHFEELGKYKYNILLKFIENENLIKALINDSEDFLNQSLPDDFDNTKLIYNYIFPYQKNFDSITEKKNFITISLGNYDYINNEFKSGRVYIYIFVHNTMLRTSYECLRFEYIQNQIDIMLNKKYGIGAFNLELVTGGEFILPNSEYYGANLVYKFTDFQ